MRKIKIAAGLAHVDYGNIADLVKQVTVAGADYIHSDAADMHDLKNMQRHQGTLQRCSTAMLRSSQGSR